MAIRALTGALLLIVALTACDRTSPAPLQPTPTPLASGLPPVPGTGPYVLTGLVFELTSAGPVPVADAAVEVAVCPAQSTVEYARTTTDHAGLYRAGGMCSGTTYLWVSKPGYRINRKHTLQCDGDCVYVDITRDTRFDVELVRE